MRGPSLLKKYLATTKQTARDFSRASKIDESLLSRWLRGERRPGIDHAEHVERVTNKAVPASAWTRKPGARAA